MPIIKTKLTVNPAAIKFIDSLPQKVIDEVYPKVISRVFAPIKEAIRVKLPDGDVAKSADEPPSRTKQSKRSKARFPGKAKESIGRKTIKDSLGTLFIIGVTSKAGHINFDHGGKAKSIGRLHKLWWVDGVNEHYATPPLRKQTVDIPLQVRTEFEGTISAAFIDEIKKAMRK
jgi:hypothetical protein